MHRCKIWVWVAVLLLLFIVGCGGSGGSGGGGHTGAQWKIGPSGGSFRSESNELRLVVPAGAVASNTTVTAAMFTTAPTAPVGTTYVVGSGWQFTHVNFTTPATLTLQFPATTPTTGLKMYRRADGATEWTPVTTTVDTGAHTASAQVSSFSSYALFYAEGTGWNWTSAGGDYLFETLTVMLQADSVAADVEVQARRTPAPFAPPTGWTAVAGGTFDLGSSNTSLTTSIPFGVSIVYDEGAVPVAVRDSVKIFYKENEAAPWTPLTSIADAANLKVSAYSSTLGTFAVLYPTPAEANAFWVELRNNQNTLYFDIYANMGGTETLLYSPAQMQGMSQLRTDTFRWADKSFLGLEFASATQTYLMSYNVETGNSIRLFEIPRRSGFIFTGVEPVRAKRLGGTDDYVVQASERNGTTFEARDSLFLFRDGATTPLVMLSYDRPDEQAPFIMRPWDVSADGRALVLISDGLALFNGASHYVLVGADHNPGEAYFSPSGDRVLVAQNSGEDGGWKVITLATGATTTIPGLDTSRKVRWASETHVIAATWSGDDRRIDLVNVETGAASRIATGGNHATSFINDVGVR